MDNEHRKNRFPLIGCFQRTQFLPCNPGGFNFAEVSPGKVSHSVYVSHPEAVASLIEEAAVGSSSTGSKVAASQH
jgi:hypothetical protein